MSARTLRIADDAPAPVTIADARAAVTRAIESASGASLISIDGRSGYVELTHQGSHGNGVHITVCDADEPDHVTGPDFLVTVHSLAFCDDHRRYYIAADRLCFECVTEQIKDDE